MTKKYSWILKAFVCGQNHWIDPKMYDRIEKCIENGIICQSWKGYKLTMYIS